MKKKILAVALIAICMSIAAFGTLAYFTYEETATNVITAGNVEISLEEWSKSDNGSLKPFENLDNVMPGTNVSKIVQIKNTGTNSAWVRISIDKSIVFADGIEGTADLSLITMDLNTEYWTELDGYYYYNDSLKAGETTEPLFTTVFFSAEMDNRYQHSKAYATITAQATQVANNGTTVFEAAGWPISE